MRAGSRAWINLKTKQRPHRAEPVAGLPKPLHHLWLDFDIDNRAVYNFVSGLSEEDPNRPEFLELVGVLVMVLYLSSLRLSRVPAIVEFLAETTRGGYVSADLVGDALQGPLSRAPRPTALIE